MSPHAEVRGITELHGGEISTVMEIALADAPACILKVYPSSLQWKMAKEVYVRGLLRDLGTAIPKILIADETRSVIDLNYLVMTRLNGGARPPTGSRRLISTASIARWSSGAGWHRSASVMRLPISRGSLRTPHRSRHHSPFDSPFAPFPLSASSVMCSTETTCSSSAVSNTITPWVERPAIRMPSTGQRISWPLSVTSMI